MDHTFLPSLPALRCFEAAARTGNFSRAADELHLTHSAISRAVRLLEDDLSIALFERRSRRVFLTEAGGKLFEAVKEGFGLVRVVARDLRASAQTAPISISCEPTLLMRFLIPRLPGFHAAHPDIPIHLIAGGGPVSFEGGIDIAIRRNDFVWAQTIVATELFREQIGLVCAPGKIDTFFDRSKSPPSLRPDAPRLHSSTRMSAWDDWAEHRGPLPKEKAGQIFEHFYFSLQAAVAGLGVAVAPWQLARDDVASGVLVAPLGFVEDGSNYSFLAPAGRQNIRGHDKLLAWLRSWA